jgi:hypothetical protein
MDSYSSSPREVTIGPGRLTPPPLTRGPPRLPEHTGLLTLAFPGRRPRISKTANHRQDLREWAEEVATPKLLVVSTAIRSSIC